MRLRRSWQRSQFQRGGSAFSAVWPDPTCRRRPSVARRRFGHHPAEMAATLAAARGAFPGRRLVLAFQPHAIRARAIVSRLREGAVDDGRLVLTEVYPAGESPIVAADGRALARAIRVQGKSNHLRKHRCRDPASDTRRGSRWRRRVTMGAGSIGGDRRCCPEVRSEVRGEA